METGKSGKEKLHVPARKHECAKIPPASKADEISALRKVSAVLKTS